MLSNDYSSYDSCGSDSSDCWRRSDESLSHANRFSAHLDHNYGPTATITTADTTTKATTGNKIDSFLNQFNPYTSDPMEEQLFEDMSAYGLDDSEAEFANAPTPFMSSCFADLNDIESDDLLDFNSNQSIPNIDNNNNTIDLSFVDNEVEIGVNPNAEAINDSQLYDHNTDRRFDGQELTQPVVDVNRRKRLLTDSYMEDESEDDDEEEDSPQQRRKAKAGRKPSKGQNKCMSRNAIAARENRERKKAYMETMEKRLRSSEESNRKMKTIINSLTKKNEQLDSEVMYLRGVLANDSTISDLIKHMAKSKQIELVGTQFMATTDAVSDSKDLRKSTRIASKCETSTQITGNRLKATVESSGVCLHINNKKVSLELCAKCSLKHTKKGK